MLGYVFNTKFEEPKTIFQIYLDGEKVGVIEDKDYFYDLINQEQSDIKESYNVDQVYPPKGFEIVERTTYNSVIDEPNEIYNEIKNGRDFTILGYTVTIKNKDDEESSPIVINVIKKEIFEEAIEKYITTFVDNTTYEKYLNDTQEENSDEKIDNMYFDDNIYIKESYISVNDKIYTNSDELVKKLLFGDDAEYKPYTVKSGDTLESIAYDNKLNVKELLIANESLKSDKTLLAQGEVLNTALISPLLNLTYEMEVDEVIDEPYKTEIKYDSSRYAGYKAVEVPGIAGKTKITNNLKMVNGQSTQAAYISKTEVLRSPQTEVVVYGSRYSQQQYIPTGDTWGLPTNFPYVITSEYGYRWGDFHEGIDISGTGYNSPIYAALDGEVIAAGWGGYLGNNAGYNVVIKHDNGYYTGYAHMSMQPIVKVGDRVIRGQQIGNMGHTGWADGTHVHFCVYVGGIPYNGGRSINPRQVMIF